MLHVGPFQKLFGNRVKQVISTPREDAGPDVYRQVMELVARECPELDLALRSA